jgi:hypothetical protein
MRNTAEYFPVIDASQLQNRRRYHQFKWRYRLNLKLDNFAK